MTNASVSSSTKFGTSLHLPAGEVPTHALVDVNGNILRTSDAGINDGTSFLGGAVTLMTLPSSNYVTPTAQTFSTEGLEYGALDITLTSFTGGTSPSITFFLDRLGADGVWYNIFASAAETAAVTYSVDISPNVTEQNVGNPTSPAAAIHGVFTHSGRFRWTVAGAPTSVVFSASFIGRK